MVMNAGGSGGHHSDINVTPLVDVVLVLLIIFMVIAPLTQRGYDVDIPTESVFDLPPEQSDKQVFLGISESGCPIVRPLGPVGLPPNCRVSINEEDVAVTDLARRTAEIFAKRPSTERIVFLAVEERLNYEGVMRIVDIAKSGVEGLRIGLVTDERVGGLADERPQELLLQESGQSLFSTSR